MTFRKNARACLAAAGLCLSLLLAPTLALAQAAPSASAPGNFAPINAPCVVQPDMTCHAIDATHPLPTAGPSSNAATSTPLTGTDSTIGTTIYGPFSPQLGRDVWVRIIGAGASGSAQLLKSDDGGTTKYGITAGGNAWATWTFSAVTGPIVNEQVVTPSDVATYYLTVTLTAGSATYRLGQ